MDPRSTLARGGRTFKGPIYELNKTKPWFLELTRVFFFAFKLGIYAKMTCFKSNCFDINSVYSPVGWGCRIHRLHPSRGLRPLDECPRYDTKQSDGEVPVMLELWGIRCTPSLSSLPGPLWPGMVAPDKGAIYALNRTNCILMLKWIVWIRTVWLNWIAWNKNVFDNWTVLTFKLRTYIKLNCLK